MKRIALLLLITACFVAAAQAQNTASVTVVDSITRPWNITQYSINDVVNDSNFTSCLRFENINDGGTVVTSKGGGGLIVSAKLTVGDSANTTNGNFRLLLFRDTVIAGADNAAWATAAYYNSRYIGYIDFQLTNDGTANNHAIASGLSMGFTLAPGRKHLYGVLLTKAAYTPVRGQKIIPSLEIIRN